MVKIDRVLLGFLDVDVGLRLTGQLVLSELVRSELVVAALLLCETGRVVRVSLKIERILIDLAHVLSHVLAHVLNHFLVLLGLTLILILRHISLSLSLLSKLSKIIVILVALLSSEIILSLSKILFHLTLVLTVTILKVSLNLRPLHTGLATLDVVVLTVHGER